MCLHEYSYRLRLGRSHSGVHECAWRVAVVTTSIIRLSDPSQVRFSGPSEWPASSPLSLFPSAQALVDRCPAQSKSRPRAEFRPTMYSL